jgi:hypothetical protein
MIRRLITGMALLTLLGQGASALTSANADDALDGDVTDGARTDGMPGVVSTPSPAAGPPPVVRAAAPVAPATSANPLWAIPLAQLSGTRDRPIFSPSRRPPPAAAASAATVAKAPPPRRRESEPPSLALVGTIASDVEGFGIFLDRSTKVALRLKVGDNYQGWKLLMIRGRDVTMAKDQQAAVLSLPQPGAGQALGEVHLLPASADTAAPAPSGR